MDDGVKDYQSTGDSPNSLDSHLFVTPVEEYPSIPSSSRPDALHEETKHPPRLPHARPHPPRLRRASSVASVALEMRFGPTLLRWIKRPLTAWLDRVGMVLSPEWCRTALLVWGVWFFMSLGASHAIERLSA